MKGHVKNDGGNVTLENKYGSIILRPSSSVSGASVNIIAENGNVIQIDPDANINVAGDPIARWLGDETNQKNVEIIIHWAATERKDGKLTDLSYSSFDDLWDNADHGLLALCEQYNAANEKKIELTKPDASKFD